MGGEKVEAEGTSRVSTSKYEGKWLIWGIMRILVCLG